jgi:hypothetical protein
MKHPRIGKFLLAGFVATLALRASPVLACAACYGKSDSPLAAAMNWGIFSLLGVVVSVLSCFAAFGVFLVRRAASVNGNASTGAATDSAPEAKQEG